MIKIRKISITVGLLILSAFIFYGVGQGLMTSAKTISLIMIFINSVVVTIIGFLFKNLLRVQDRSVIKIYLSTRIIEAILLFVGGIFLYVSQVTDLASMEQSAIMINRIVYNIGMISLGIGSTILFSYSLKPKLFPKWLCIWGTVGYICLITGSILDIFSIQSSMYFLIPGGLFEVVISFWLIIRGQKANIK